MTISSTTDSDIAHGSIVVVLGDPANKDFQDTVALAKNNPAMAVQQLKGLYHQFENRPILDLAEAVAQTRSAPVLSDIRIGPKTLAKNIPVLPTSPVTILTFPYNGGQLPSDQLTIVQKQRTSSDEVGAFAFVRPPMLTGPEKAAIAHLPAWQRELNVGESARCWAATAVTVAATVVAATGLCHRSTDLIDPHVGVDDLRKLGAASSAIQLLQLRRETLGRMTP
jgi:hypothetical protein